MSEPVSKAELPAGFVKIQGDPTWWGLRTAPPHGGWDAPIQLPIILPVAGNLILSPARVGSYTLKNGTSFEPMNGWVDGPPIELVHPYLYTPTTSGLTAASHAYPLAADVDLTGLRKSILDAMTAGSLLLVPVDVSGARVILNGAQLPFAVLAEAA
jgi:hypothetical protein